MLSGERVSNTWVTYPKPWDNSGKPGLIPDEVTLTHVFVTKSPLV